MFILKSKADKVFDAILMLLLGIIALVCLFPIANAVAISFSDKASAAANKVYFWPVNFNVGSYIMIVDDGRFLKAAWISLQRVLLGGTLNFVLTILMAYPLSKDTKKFKSRNLYMWVVIFTMLFSGGLIPWYMTIRACNLLDTIWALVLPNAVPVFNVILLMNFFKGVPKELEEAAEMDGAGPWRILLRIYLQLSLPAMATVTLFSLVGHWNSFFDGMILMNANNYPLQTYIQQLVIMLNEISRLTPEQIQRLNAVSNKTLNMAKFVVSIIPVLVVYPFIQRYFTTGIVLGAVKE